MSQQTSGTPAPAGPATGPSTTQAARDEAAHVARSTADAGRHVAGTASDQAGEVVAEARRQAKDLLGEARGQAAEQVRNGQQKATEGLRALSAELREMADAGERSGPASDLAAQAAGRVDDAAEWLSRHEAGDVIDEVRRFARRRPGAFLVGAALAGALAGRLTRGAIDANRDTEPRTQELPPVPRTSQLPPPGYSAGAPTPMPYDEPYDEPYGRSYDQPGGGTSLPPGGPLDDPSGPRPYVTGPGGPVGSDPGAPSPGPEAVPPMPPVRPGSPATGDHLQDAPRGAVPHGEGPAR